MKKNVMNWILILFNLAYIIPFGLKFILTGNWEFVLYVAILLGLFLIVASVQKKVKFSYPVLWGLSVWGLLHMLGGGIKFLNGEVLYALKIIPIWVTQNFYILKYDQVVHFYLYFVMVFVIYALIKSELKQKWKPLTLYLIIMLASIGVGALNEVAEFLTVLMFENTGVGGYYNTAWDIVFNTLGSLLGVLTLWLKQKKNF